MNQIIFSTDMVNIQSPVLIVLGIYSSKIKLRLIDLYLETSWFIITDTKKIILQMSFQTSILTSMMTAQATPLKTEYLQTASSLNCSCIV